ncbi:MAG: FkbM family methyltransferase [Anaerolineales bacterium]|nr:FkbM family methyltransferase [Anaerolineales bacterium]
MPFDWRGLLRADVRRLPGRLWRRLSLSVRPDARGTFALPDGLRFECPLDTGLARALTVGVFEPAEQAFVRQTLRPGDLVLDVGANYGLFTLLAARRVGPAGRVYAFEPSARERAGLLKNIAANGLTNVTVLEQAVADRPGLAQLAVARDGGLNALARNAHPEQAVTHWQPVSVTTLDDFVAGAGLPRVDFLKIDVEGAEALVLRGAARLLAQTPAPTILCEFCDVTAAGFNSSGRQLYDLFQASGYALFQLAGAAEARLVPAPPADQYPYQNLVALRRPAV